MYGNVELGCLRLTHRKCRPSLLALLSIQPLTIFCLFGNLPIDHSTAIVSVFSDIVHSVNSGKVLLLIVLDLSAAFDTVDHVLLLSVLTERLSINSTALSWFKLYPTNQSQSFVYAAGQMPDFPVDCSISHGSVFGPRTLGT